MTAWSWLTANWDSMLQQLWVHTQITFAALLLGVVFALPLGVAGYRWPALYPLVRAATQATYTIPALALYSLVILVLNLVAALRGVPWDITEAAAAMGYRPLDLLLHVQLPLALPALVAGLRAATVSTISLVSLGALIGTGGLGQLFIHGFQVDNSTEIVAGLVATLGLALISDLILVAVGREATPWLKGAR